jgi:NADH dehydrogenase FAD-containing subunit
MTAATAVRPQRSSRRGLSVVIVGAGFGGIAATIELKRHGITPADGEYDHAAPAALADA